jgi:hypothetical protein
MNQNLLSIFSVVVNEKNFQFIPANSDFDEVQQALDQLKADFAALKEDRLKAEAESKVNADVVPVVPAPAQESPVIEAEVVNA